jgi:hypothetical protein
VKIEALAMTYRPLQLHSSTPARFRSFVKRKLDRHFLIPARELLKLPRAHSPVDAQFTTTVANTLISVISGVSVLGFTADRKNAGTKFKTILERCFPWNEEPAGAPPPTTAAQLLYDYFRNPLAHAVGIGPDGKQVMLLRKIFRTADGQARGYFERELVALESASRRPAGPRPTVIETTEGARVNVDGLYWGVRVMVERATSHTDLMTEADRQLALWGHW